MLEDASEVCWRFGNFVCSVLEGHGAVTQRGGHGKAEGGHSPYPTTQDTERDGPLVTTAPPFNVLNHHPPYKGFLVPESHHTDDFRGHQQFFEDSGGATMPGSGHHLVQEPSTQLMPHEDVPAFSDIASPTPTTAAMPASTIAARAGDAERHASKAKTPETSQQVKTTVSARDYATTESLTTAMHTSAPPPCASTPGVAVTMGQGPSDRARVAIATTVAPPALTTPVKMDDVAETERSGAQNNKSPDGNIPAAASADLEEETTTTTIITTTVITTMQTPAPCLTNFTAPEGYIETPKQEQPQPQQSGSWYYWAADCTYTVTVYLGYGVEIQVRCHVF
ncbi:hypothetical protein ACEWY4_008317 [Coilia grayii]|uniref:Uncharacterized protein n=1 Tax=Coilia grayii TaxID=363190 RepID=A0ABD1KAQ5_9TELE